jgi:hypothetical protein
LQRNKTQTTLITNNRKFDYSQEDEKDNDKSVDLSENSANAQNNYDKPRSQSVRLISTMDF